jgi:hypothetical protein
MDQVEALESEHAKAPAGEVEERGGPMPPRPSTITS